MKHNQHALVGVVGGCIVLAVVCAVGGGFAIRFGLVEGGITAGIIGLSSVGVGFTLRELSRSFSRKE